MSIHRPKMYLFRLTPLEIFSILPDFDRMMSLISPDEPTFPSTQALSVVFLSTMMLSLQSPFRSRGLLNAAGAQLQM